MELQFAPPSLKSLDASSDELLVVYVFADERPPRGAAGLFDWRTAGRISRLIQEGFFTAKLGEVLLVPGRPALPFDKVLLFGGGDLTHLDEGVFSGLIERTLRTVEGLCVRNVVTQLPGRDREQLEPERAAELLLQHARGKSVHEVWTLLEPAAAQLRISARRLDQSRTRAHTAD